MNTDEYSRLLQLSYPFLNTSDIAILLEQATYRFCENKETVLAKGNKAPTVFFILKGTVRGYFMNEKGEEKNIFLRPEGTLTGAPEALFSGLPSKYSFEAILETHLLVFNLVAIKAAAQKHPNIMEIYIAGLQENIQTLIGRVEGLIDKSAEERYTLLLERSPHFFQTAYHKHIANYLGINPVSLSRIIRKKSRGG